MNTVNYPSRCRVGAVVSFSGPKTEFRAMRAAKPGGFSRAGCASSWTILVPYGLGSRQSR